MKLLRRYQSTTSAAFPQSIDGEVIPPSEPPPVSAGQAIDWRSLLALLGMMAFFGLVAAWAYGRQQGLAASAVLILWGGGMVLFVMLLIFVQSETLLQFVAFHLYAFVELRRIRSARLVWERHYEAEETKAEITERLRIEAGLAATRQVEQHSQPQITMNQVHGYVAPEAEQVEAIDTLRLELLRFVSGLYDSGANMDTGYIPGGVPWSRRGAMKHDAERIERMLADVATIKGRWLLRRENNGWWLNVKEYPTAGRAVKAFERVRTPV